MPQVRDGVVTYPDDQSRDPGQAAQGYLPGLRQVMRRFDLFRETDASHISGVGYVAEGVEFTDGTVVIRWRSTTPSTVIWASIEDAVAIHGHNGWTRVEWRDGPEPGVRLEAA